MIARKAVFIFGPTGVGKSYVSERVALELGYELVNMDIGSFLAPLDIGTAKPNLSKCPVRFHLFDVIEKPEDFNVIDYRQKVIEALTQMRTRRALPLFVGGSAFYMKSLFFPPISTLGKRNEKKVQRIFSKRKLWELLNKIDPLRAGALHPNDTYRVQRALSVWSDTEQKPSDFAPKYDPLFKKSTIVFIERDRQDLYDRINARVDYMMRCGFLSEAMAAYHDLDWRDFLQWKKIIGYSELFEFLRGRDHSDQMLRRAVEKVKQRTRRYAKRQMTFWRMLKKELNAVTNKEKSIILKEVNLSNIPASEHAKVIVSLI